MIGMTMSMQPCIRQEQELVCPICGGRDCGISKHVKMLGDPGPVMIKRGFCPHCFAQESDWRFKRRTLLRRWRKEHP